MPTVAAIDVGSNAIRLVTLTTTAAGSELALDYKRYGLRLGAGVFATGRVPEPQAAELLAVFDDIAARLAAAGVERYRAVATAAMREAANGVMLSRQIRERCGVKLEIIDGEEESGLSKSALVRSIGTPRGASTLLVDMGGGSLELERAGDGRGVSLPFGTVRLLDRFPQLLEPMVGADLLRLSDGVYRELRRALPSRAHATTAAGTGGNLDALARLVPMRGAAVPAINLKKLPALAGRLAGMTVTERARRYGLRVDRAEVILPAAVILQAVVSVYGLRSFLAPGSGLRQALLDQLVPAPKLERTLEALLTSARRPVREAAALATIARQLFEALAALHGLWAPALGPLLAAAYLRGVGHTLDETLVQVLGLDRDLGLDESGRRVAAWAVAASFGKKPRALARALPADDEGCAKTLGALLTLAVRLREHGPREPPVADLTAEPLTIDCRLARRVAPGVLLEVQRVLGRKLRVR